MRDTGEEGGWPARRRCRGVFCWAGDNDAETPAVIRKDKGNKTRLSLDG